MLLLSFSSSVLGLRLVPPAPSRRRRGGGPMFVSMRDRSKNRKPLQRGRNLSIEAIQVVQALKRAKFVQGGDAVDHVIQQKVHRLVKFDLMAVLAELQRQNEGSLSFQVFEEARREHWYKPQLSVYGDMVRVLANSGLLEKLKILISYWKMESFQGDTVGLNTLLETLLEFGFAQIAMDCYHMMKLWEIEPDESTFRILISGLENNGEIALSSTVRDDAMEYFGGCVDFLEEFDGMEDTDSASSHFNKLRADFPNS